MIVQLLVAFVTTSVRVLVDFQRCPTSKSKPTSHFAGMFSTYGSFVRRHEVLTVKPRLSFTEGLLLVHAPFNFQIVCGLFFSILRLVDSIGLIHELSRDLKLQEHVP
jgi:hypothetical protein